MQWEGSRGKSAHRGAHNTFTYYSFLVTTVEFLAFGDLYRNQKLHTRRGVRIADVCVLSEIIVHVDTLVT